MRALPWRCIADVTSCPVRTVGNSVIEIQMSERQRQDVAADITPERDTSPCSFEAGDATLGSFFIRVTSSRIAEDASMLHEYRHATVSLLAL